MGSHTLRKVEEEQRCLLDLLNGRFFPDLGILDIETDKIRYIIYIAVVGKFELENRISLSIKILVMAKRIPA